MGVFDIGGGGGKAGLVTPDSILLDKPFDLTGPMGPDTLAQIDQMFTDLYRSLRRTVDTVEAIPTTSTTEEETFDSGGEAATLLMKETTISNDQILALFGTPVEVVSAVAGKVIIPVFIAAEIVRADAYSASRNLNFHYDGDAGLASVVASTASFIANAATNRTATFYPATLGFVTSTFNPVGAALVAKLSGASEITGGGAGNFIILRVYYLESDDLS